MQARKKLIGLGVVLILLVLILGLFVLPWIKESKTIKLDTRQGTTMPSEENLSKLPEEEKTKVIQESKEQSETELFSNELVRVMYYGFSPKEGAIGFSIQNKTDKVLAFVLTETKVDGEQADFLNINKPTLQAGETKDQIWFVPGTPEKDIHFKIWIQDEEEKTLYTSELIQIEMNQATK